MGLASLNPLSRLRGAVRSLVAEAVGDALHDTLSAFGTAIRHDGDRTRSDLAGLRSDVADFRARHGFVGDPVAVSPAVTASGDRMVPRHPPAIDQRLPPGRHHP